MSKMTNTEESMAHFQAAMSAQEDLIRSPDYKTGKAFGNARHEQGRHSGHMAGESLGRKAGHAEASSLKGLMKNRKVRVGAAGIAALAGGAGYLAGKGREKKASEGNKYLEKIAKKEPSKLRAAGRGALEALVGGNAASLVGAIATHSPVVTQLAGLGGAAAGALHGYKASIRNQKKGD